MRAERKRCRRATARTSTIDRTNGFVERDEGGIPGVLVAFEIDPDQPPAAGRPLGARLTIARALGYAPPDGVRPLRPGARPEPGGRGRPRRRRARAPPARGRAGRGRGPP